MNEVSRVVERMVSSLKYIECNRDHYSVSQHTLCEVQSPPPNLAEHSS